MTRRGVVLRVVVLVAVVASLVVLETQVGFPSEDEVRGWFDDRGWVAVPAFVGFYAVATLLPLPKAVCTIVGGAVLGFWTGLAAVLVGATVGSTLAFLGARWLGRDSVRGLSAERVRRVDEQIGRRGFSAVLAARLLPVIPFTSLNYVLGLTSIRLAPYVLATAVGIVPGTAVYVAVGAFGFEPGSWPFAIAIAGLVVLTVIGVTHQRRVRSRDPLRTTGDEVA
ncbi:SNARE-like domain protein [Aeromicrobium marinum DSM 15272]|uniref:TVP38/TMEM64 family membrane protein n=1 Tax=Aeromicrobium marinum DSM 15272 TaxID=585531 RepID=E2SEY8_9ACTN|nr:TVP38/TMEM64 family protein [Aeromicrobium marinum]EFQ82232.1 SNARE-like domain protein [Aeromicrobium marinum DSM 15272]